MPRIRVDLPVPFAPSRATRSPGARVIDTSRSTGWPPYPNDAASSFTTGRGERSGSRKSKTKRLSTGTGATARIRSSALSRLWACRALLAL